jgi:hypothetical protein
MTIEDPRRYVNGIWDWACLDGCFGTTKIKPQDIDGFVERNGEFLSIEAKSIGTPLKQGQEICWKQRIKSGVDTVIVIWGDPATKTIQRMQILSAFGDETIDPCTLEDFRRKVSAWFKFSERKPPKQAKRIITAEAVSLLRNLDRRVGTIESLLLQLINQTKSVRPIKKENVIALNG